MIRSTALAAVLALAAVNDSLAQSYPTRPVRMLVGFAAGGGPDIVGRVVAQRLAEILGQQVVIDNRVGAGGSIAEAMLAKSPADGYTLLMCASSIAINPALYKNLAYDAQRDLAPISLSGISAQVLILLPSFPARTLPALIALAKAKPGALTFASSGVGAGSHLAGELFRSMAGIDLTHVPYKGGGQGISAVLSGETVLMFAPISSAIPHVKTGRLRAVAVTTASRSAVSPEVPTMAEAGLPGYEAYPWYGVLAPAGTPPALISRLHAALAESVKHPATRERLLGLGVDPVGGSPTEFARFIHAETAKWAKIVRQAGVKAD